MGRLMVIGLSLLLLVGTTLSARSDEETRERFYGNVVNSTAPGNGEGSIAKMFDRVLEKEFSENDQPEGSDGGASFNSSVADQQVSKGFSSHLFRSINSFIFAFSLILLSSPLLQGWNRDGCKSDAWEGQTKWYSRKQVRQVESSLLVLLYDYYFNVNPSFIFFLFWAALRDHSNSKMCFPLKMKILMIWLLLTKRWLFGIGYSPYFFTFT